MNSSLRKMSELEKYLCQSRVITIIVRKMSFCPSFILLVTFMQCVRWVAAHFCTGSNYLIIRISNGSSTSLIGL